MTSGDDIGQTGVHLPEQTQLHCGRHACSAELGHLIEHQDGEWHGGQRMAPCLWSRTPRILYFFSTAGKVSEAVRTTT